MNYKVFSLAKDLLKGNVSGKRKRKLKNVEAENDKNKKKVKELKNRLADSQIEMQRAHVEFSLYQNEWRQTDRERAGTSGNFIKGNPLVSIVILNRNGLDNLRILMESFVNKRFYSNFEIIFVDNGSTDESVSFVEGYKDRFTIRIIENGENKSFSEANNIGIREAKGDYYLFLNNDIELTNGWLDELIHACQKHGDAGAVGARLFYPDIPRNQKKTKRSFAIQHAGVIFKEVVREGQYFIQPYNRGNCEPDKDHLASDEHLAAVTAAALLVEAGKFHEIGGFDEQYVYGYEDVDLCLKLDEAGYRNIYCPHCILFHYEFGTQKEDDKEEVYLRRLNNFKIFRKRWQDYLSGKILEDKRKGTHVYTDQVFLVTVLSDGPLTGKEAGAVNEKIPDLTGLLEELFGDKDGQPATGRSADDRHPRKRPAYQVQLKTYNDYRELEKDDMETDLLIDPAGLYMNTPHRKASRRVLTSWD